MSKPFGSLLAAMGAMVLSAGAQQSGQSIIFSSPQNDDAQSAMPPLVQPGSPPSLPGTAPVSPFNYVTPNSFPAAPPRANAADQQRMRKILDDRKNWTLMTPAEIFGATPDKPLQPTERDGTGREKNQTQLERYLDRENQPQPGRTNGWQNDRANPPWNLARDRDGANPSDPRRNDPAEASQNFNFSRLFNSARPGDAPANQNGNAGWDVFSPPAPPAPVKPNPEQLAAMQRFRQLLEPSPAPASPSPPGEFFSAPKRAADPFMTQPAFVPNPAGASFMPLSSGAGRPVGLTPLPGITTPFSHPSAVPSWTPKPPPWVSQGPQLFDAPQWKF